MAPTHDELEALRQQVAALTGRIFRLEQRLGLATETQRPEAARPTPAASQAPPVASSPATSSAPPAVPPPPLFTTSSPSGANSESTNLESKIGKLWLNRIGIVAILAGTAYFLKYAFDNNWIGPRGRVGIGILLGAAMLPWSQWLLARGYQYFSEGIAALGATVLYLSIWAGWHYYSLFEQSTAFAGMIVATAAMIAVAVGRDSHSAIRRGRSTSSSRLRS